MEVIIDNLEAKRDKGFYLCGGTQNGAELTGGHY